MKPLALTLQIILIAFAFAAGCLLAKKLDRQFNPKYSRPSYFETGLTDEQIKNFFK